MNKMPCTRFDFDVYEQVNDDRQYERVEGRREEGE